MTMPTRREPAARRPDPPDAQVGAPAEAGPGRPRSRIRPQELAAHRGGTLEGLEWLGRTPEARPTLTARVLAVVARLLLFGILRFRVTVSGRELLPASGGYLLVAGAHRGWMDPLIVLHSLPLEPRVWFLGSGPSTFTSRWKEALIRRAGGLLPVWRGGVGIEQHIRAARAVLDAGAVFAQMPEGTVNGPAGKLGPFRPGAGVIALRVGAPIVPMAIAGTEELYLGRRMAARILPSTSVAELLGSDWDGILPSPGSREELALARRVVDAIAARIGPVVEELQPGTVDPPDRPRRLRRRLTWLLLGPGPLER